MYVYIYILYVCVLHIYIYTYIHIHITSKQKIIWETTRISAAYALGTAMPSSAACSCPGRRPKVHRSKPPCEPSAGLKKCVHQIQKEHIPVRNR